MPGLAAVATCSYNGFTFDGSAKVKASSANIRDDAGRTTVCIEHTLTVAATVASGNGSSVDASLDSIRAALSCDGGVLIYSNGGFGSALQVNVGVIRDVRWGPKTDIVSWEPVGSHGAAEIVWTVKTWLPPCTLSAGTSLLTPGIMALNFEADYSIDEHGDTTRTISGYYEIAQTRAMPQAPCSSRLPPDSCDKYRTVIAPAPPIGFTRTQTWHDSLDKRRCDFTITDRQIPSPNAYPAGVTEIDAKHSLRIARGSWAKNRNVLTCNMQRNRGVTGAAAWSIFLKILTQRIQAAEAKGHKCLISTVDFEEAIFGRGCNFRAEYLTLGIIADYLGESGLWKPLGTDWGLWQTSLLNSTFNQRGNAGLILDASQDVIVDLCGRPNANTNSPANVDYIPGIQAGTSLRSSTPTPERSWIVYQAGTTAAWENPVAVHEPLQDPGTAPSGTPSPSPSSGGNPAPPNAVTNPAPADGETAVQSAAIANVGQAVQDALDAPPVGNATQGAQFNTAPPQEKPAAIQTRGASSWRVRLAGHAVRAGYPIPRPSIQKVGDQIAYEINGWFHCRFIGSHFGVPVYRAAWDIVYALSSHPVTVKPNLTLMEQ